MDISTMHVRTKAIIPLHHEKKIDTYFGIKHTLCFIDLWIALHKTEWFEMLSATITVVSGGSFQNLQ